MKPFTLPTSGPQMSVILVTPDTYRTLRRVVGALRRQTVRERLELVFAVPSGRAWEPVAPDLNGFAGVRVVTVEKVFPLGHARAAAVRASTAPVVAFTEDHCFPAPGWAEALLDRHREGWSGVGPLVCNANPATVASWADIAFSYGDWIDPRSAGERTHLPGHNSSYKRDALLELGECLGDELASDSAMLWRLGQLGHRFYLEPRARIHHLNPSDLVAYAHHLPPLGRAFAGNRCRNWSLVRRLAYTAGSPLIPLVRLARCFSTLARVRGWTTALPALPGMVFELSLSACGEFLGYLTGSTGGPLVNELEIEFFRERYLTRAERQWFDALAPDEAPVPESCPHDEPSRIAA